MITINEITIELTSRNINHYEQLGYNIPRKYSPKKGKFTVPRGTKINVKTTDLLENSGYKLPRVCDFCGEECGNISYQMILKYRSNNNGKDICSTCSYKTRMDTWLKNIKEEDTLAYNYPELINEWDYEKNEKLTPYNISSNSGKTVWWKGNCGHSWDTKVSTRTSGCNCPFCDGKRIDESNCLASTHSELVKEWHPSKNGELTPYAVTGGQSIYVWWLGSCGHEWNTKISTRASGGYGCPFCKKSKGEDCIKNYLDKKFILYQPQFTIEGLNGIRGGNLRFDFAVFDNNNKLHCLLEYDGEFHFNDIYKNGSYELINAHDILKNDYCIDNAIKLIRIPYWEFDNIESILEESLFKNKTCKYEIETMNEVE